MESTTMREAFEEIDRLSQNKETRRLADFREQELMGILQREEDGVEQAKREIVIEMYTDGMSAENIAKYVKLPFENVVEIIKSIEQ